MNITPIVASQVVIMLALILVGFILFKKNIITKNGTKDMSGILLNLVLPCVLIKAYQIEYNPDIVRELLLAFALSILAHGIFIALSYIIWRFEKDEDKRINGIFTAVYSNCGFMGIPLLGATLGDKGVLLGSAYLATFNILIWTHGLCMYGKSAKYMSVKNIVKNPGVIGVTLALILFFARVRISGPVKEIVGYFASLNTPLAMLLLGTYLARGSITKAFREPGIYLIIFLRLLAFPLISAIIFALMGIEEFLATTVVLSAACPVAALSAIFSEKFNLDTLYPSQIVSVTTLLSVATMPLITFLISFILK